MITTYTNLPKDTMSRKYRVEQSFTTGWGVVDETSFKLSKDEAKKVLEESNGRRCQPRRYKSNTRLMYIPQVDDYVKWTTDLGMVHEGWVYWKGEPAPEKRGWRKPEALYHNRSSG